jgi:hypothetical protein
MCSQDSFPNHVNSKAQRDGLHQDQFALLGQSAKSIGIDHSLLNYTWDKRVDSIAVESFVENHTPRFPGSFIEVEHGGPACDGFEPSWQQFRALAVETWVRLRDLTGDFGRYYDERNPSHGPKINIVGSSFEKILTTNHAKGILEVGIFWDAIQIGLQVQKMSEEKGMARRAWL